MLDFLEAEEGYRPDIVLRLLATAPLQQPEDIDGVVDTLLADPHATSAMVVAEARQHPMKACASSTTTTAPGWSPTSRTP
jgi:CMP-N-acetylneuraminic acid synthetase